MRAATLSRNLAGVRFDRCNGVAIGQLYGSPGQRTYSTTDADCADMVIQLLAIKAEAEAATAAAAKAEADLQALIDALPRAVSIIPVALQPDGRFSLTVPEPGHDGAWSKHVTSIDAAGQNGTAFDGSWLKCGCSTVLSEGDMICVGSKYWTGSRKNGEWHKTRDLYIVTPAGLIGHAGNTAAAGAETLALDPTDRVLRVMEAALKTCEARIEKLDGLDREKFAPVAATIAERRAGYCARAEALRVAIEKASQPAPVTSVAEAAAAIIAAGYKALAAVNHPDRGGNAATMRLLTDARNALRDLLALANEQVAA